MHTFMNAVNPPCGYIPDSRASHCSIFTIHNEDIEPFDLETRVVGPGIRHRLLSSGTSQDAHSPQGIHTDAATSAQALLADLIRLAPSVARDFIARTPPSSQYDTPPFRLIHPSASSHSDPRSYIALSYTRSHTHRLLFPRLLTTNLPFGVIRTDSQVPLPISAALFRGALAELRPREGLWFDASCIDLSDEVERASAIADMDAVYSSARVVVVALDDVLVGEEEMRIFKAYGDGVENMHLARDMRPPVMAQWPSLAAFVERVIASAWFGRAWCTLEMRVAKRHVFLVAGEGCEEEDRAVLRFTGAFFAHLLALVQEVITSTPLLRRIRELWHFFSNIPAAAATPSPPPSLIPTTAEISTLRASGNPRLPTPLRTLSANRDKTSIALLLARSPLALAPPSPLQRPLTIHESHRTLLLLALAARDPLALCTTGAPLTLHDGSISWLCAPTSLDGPPSRNSAVGASSPISQPLPPFARPTNSQRHIQHASDGRAEFAHLDLVFLGLPHRTRPNADFPALVLRARDIVDAAVQTGVRCHPLWDLWQTAGHPRTQAMRNAFVQTLACVFDCGADWLLDVISRPTFPALGGAVAGVLNTSTLAPLFSSHSHPYSSSETWAFTYTAAGVVPALLSTIALLIAHGIPWASSASERTHGPLVVTSPSPSPSSLSSSSASSFSSPAASPGGKALIFAPFAHSSTLLVAVPAVLRPRAYAGLARAWVLTPRSLFTGGGAAGAAVSWVLRGKGVVFGEGGFERGVEACGEGGWRSHRVFGPGEGGGDG